MKEGEERVFTTNTVLYKSLAQEGEDWKCIALSLVWFRHIFQFVKTLSIKTILRTLNM